MSMNRVFHTIKAKTNTASVTLLIVTALIAGCGGGGSSGSSGSSNISWSGNSNISRVLDGNGNPYAFSSSNLCMYSTISNVGPAGFCLSGSGSSTGPTNCVNPSTNSYCDAASFSVNMTNNPGGSGCIAVLGTPVAFTMYDSTYAQHNYSLPMALDVTNSGTGFYIQTYKPTAVFLSGGNGTLPSAYSTYWTGVIPVCGGSNPYQGTYAMTATESCTATATTNTSNYTFTVDSGGWVAGNVTNGIWGGISASTGTGTFTGAPSYMSGTITYRSNYTISSAVLNGSNKWVLSGTYTSATSPVTPCSPSWTHTFTATQQ